LCRRRYKSTACGSPDESMSQQAAGESPTHAYNERTRVSCGLAPQMIATHRAIPRFGGMWICFSASLAQPALDRESAGQAAVSFAATPIPAAAIAYNACG